MATSAWFTTIGIVWVNTPLLTSFMGNVDGQGNAIATLNLLPAHVGVLVGQRLNFAVLGFGAAATFTSNPAELIIE